LKERFPFGKENIMKILCEGCGELGHSFENCPKLTEEQKEEIRRNWKKRDRRWSKI
jgi:hypothetical protein